MTARANQREKEKKIKGLIRESRRNKDRPEKFKHTRNDHLLTDYSQINVNKVLRCRVGQPFEELIGSNISPNAKISLDGQKIKTQGQILYRNLSLWLV